MDIPERLDIRVNWMGSGDVLMNKSAKLSLVYA